jgi:hypothetical protein
MNLSADSINNQIMNKIFRYISTTLPLLLFSVVVVFADPPSPPGPGGNPTSSGGTPVGAPIDSGVWVLLVLGVLYGALKLYQKNINKQQRVVGEEDNF